MIRLILIFLVVFHGLIHSLGFVKAYKLAEVNQLTQEISKTAGLFWLFSTILFLLTAAAMIAKKDWWWMLAASALVISQLFIFISWKDAKFGTLANLIILTATILAYAAWSFNAQGKKELKSFLLPIPSEKKVITKEMTGRLPSLIQNWLIQSKVVNHDTIQIIHLKQRGERRGRQAASGGGLRFLTIENRQHSHHPGLDFVLATPSARADLTTSGELSLTHNFLTLYGCPRRSKEGVAPAIPTTPTG